MEFHPNELLLYFDPSTSTGKQTRAYAHSISNHVNELDYHKVKLTTTLWKEIINMLKLRPKDLLNKAHREYQEKVAGHSYTMEGWLKVLANNPQMLKAPIAVWNRKAILCKKPTDILKIS